MVVTFGSLFSGIGGFDLGFEQAGLSCAWQVEFDAKCNEVLNHHWPNVEKFKDVRDVGKHNLRPVDIICGGFPCQDVSVAGKRKGLAGKQSGLWYEFHRVLEELRPQQVVIENVPGLLSGCGCTTCQAVRRIIKIHSWIRERKGGVKCPICIAGERMLKSHSGRNFTTILQGLAQLGYLSAWRILDAQFDGVAQRRRRVFLVGSLRNGSCAEILFEPESLSWDTPPSCQEGQEATRDVTYCIDQGGGKGLSRYQIEVSPSLTESMTPHAITVMRNREGCKGGGKGPMFSNKSFTLAQSNDQAIVTSQGYLARGIGARPNSKTVPTLRANTGDQFPIVFNWQSGGDVRLGISKEHTSALHAGQVPATCQGIGIRRLTPTECTRLQGFPDNWNDWLSDTARYKQFGNAVCVPVAKWIGQRIKEVFMQENTFSLRKEK